LKAPPPERARASRRRRPRAGPRRQCLRHRQWYLPHQRCRPRARRCALRRRPSPRWVQCRMVERRCRHHRKRPPPSHQLRTLQRQTSRRVLAGGPGHGAPASAPVIPAPHRRDTWFHSDERAADTPGKEKDRPWPLRKREPTIAETRPLLASVAAGRGAMRLAPLAQDCLTLERPTKAEARRDGEVTSLSRALQDWPSSYLHTG